MASLRQEHRYGLSCGRNRRSSAERTLYLVKLTDTAIRALGVLQNLKESLSSEPSICFKGSQGYIKIPAPRSESPSAFRVFSFYLSSDNKDQPQASFDCIHHDRREQLEVQGSIQDKITVCATDDSYQMTRERMSQVEKDSWSHSAIEIKPGAAQPNKCVKYQKRPAPLPAMDNGFYKQSISSQQNGSPSAASKKPLKERIIHLLALKPYSKPELLLWLERDKGGPKDKSRLGGILDEVAKVNPKDNSYLLRGNFYKHVQKDWPGYNEEERQLISRLLNRKLQTHINKQSTAPQENFSVLKTSQNQSLAKCPAVKRPLPSDLMESLIFKTKKVTNQQLQQEPAGNRQWNSEETHTTAALTPSPSLHTKTEFERTSDHPEDLNSLLGRHNSFTLLHKLSSNSDRPVSETKEPETTVNSLQPSQCDAYCTREQLANNQPRKKKSKKHRDKMKNCLDSEWGIAHSDLKDNPDKLNNIDITNAVASEEKPDFVIIYGSIKSLEQRKRYLKDFNAEYDEYIDLHSRIATITCMFVQLESKIKSLSPGTTEYKIMEDQVLEKYNKYQKKFPGYREEKKRCEYLHEKLAYIKQRVIDYDVSTAPS